jgi:DNA repair exonuclease SbcCD ATPase subunit
MKKRNILFGATAMLLVGMLSSFVSGPQGNFRDLLKRSPETRANLVTKMMKDKLSLDDNQFDKAYQINLKYARLIQPYLLNAERTPEVKNQVVEMNKQRRKELQAILTPEQLKQAEALRQQRIDRLENILDRLKENQFSNP